ncbi:MAG: hypothetical protein KGN84_09480, partial [Acidobacteriota bacterium]|nr:hypothetical protein [Acidobacteriota bacterium]
TLVPLQNKISSFQQEMWQAVRTGSAGSKDAVLPVNDFEEVVFARHTELGRIKDRLKRAGAVSALMTGSGSSVFGIFRDRADLLRAQKSLRNETCFAISFLSRSRYQAAWRRALKPHVKGDLWPPQSLYGR